jgi:hypothetical protein
MLRISNIIKNKIYYLNRNLSSLKKSESKPKPKKHIFDIENEKWVVDHKKVLKDKELSKPKNNKEKK